MDELLSNSSLSTMTIENTGDLKKLLGTFSNVDSYLTSPTYYLFTGRNGLWLSNQQNIVNLIAHHPNIPDRLIVYPDPENGEISQSLLNILPCMPEGIQTGRVKKNDQTIRISPAWRNTEENVLDWKFPVRILSTQDTASCSGHQYMYIRNRLRQLKHHKISVQPLNAILHSKIMENLLHRWVSHYAKSQADYNNLYAPYEYLFSLSMEEKSGLNGLMFFVDGTLEALSLWDVSNQNHPCANLFVNICNTHIRGLSEYLVVKTCETLAQNNVSYLNLGGSEWSGLDHFKKKFVPTQSVDLCTYEYIGHAPQMTYAKASHV